jgi:2-C-methyl-D-erythritol 4-phosphate cytidylyltransferase
MEFVASELATIKKKVNIVSGGRSRAESAINGFRAVGDGVDYVAIHDVARPFVTPEQIKMVIEAAHECGAASAVSLVTDTVKEIDEHGYIVKTHSRERLRRAETPQAFSVGIYAEAISSFGGDLSQVTDDNMLIENLGVPVRTVDIGSGNIKLTVPADLRYAEFLLMGDENNE